MPSRHSSDTGVGPTPSSKTKSVRPGAIVPSAASANVEPIVGWPAIGSSSPGVKMRILMSPPRSGGKMNVHSEKFISRVIACMVCGVDRARFREYRELISFERARW